MNFLDAYANYLFRREAAILMSFRRRGRTRRVLIPAYWQASFLPLAFPAGFFLALLLGATVGMALATGASLLGGIMVGEALMFQQNKMAWPVFERVLQWDKLASFHQQAIGPLPSVSRSKAQTKAEESVPIPVRRMILKGYVAARRNAPSFEGWAGRAPEVRMILAILAIMMTFGFTQLFVDPLGLWLLIPTFFLGLQLRRAKMAIDFVLTWPLMERFIDWQAVYRDAGAVDEVEF